MVGNVMYDYQGESIIITSSTSGVNYGVGKALTEIEIFVVINSQIELNVKVITTELDKIGDGNIIRVPVDISQINYVEELVEYAINVFREDP